MLVLGIDGIPRGDRGATMRLIRAVLNGAQEGGAEVEAVNLVDYDLLFRNACTSDRRRLGGSLPPSGHTPRLCRHGVTIPYQPGGGRSNTCILHGTGPRSET